jgi:hypothetical protein
MMTKTWHVDLFIGERDGRTHVEARLEQAGRDNARTLSGHGVARLNPSDREVPEIGDELAAARALSDLAHRLLDATAGDIESVTHKPAHLAG